MGSINESYTPLMRSRSPLEESVRSYQSVESSVTNFENGEKDNSLDEPGNHKKSWRRSLRLSLRNVSIHSMLSSLPWITSRRGPQCRVMDRDGPFYQSTGRWNIRRIKNHQGIKDLIGKDFFHTLVNQDTSKIIMGMIALYLFIVGVFGVIYLLISTTMGCNLHLTTLREAYIFSLETMSTVGYGTDDYLFGSCWIMVPVLSAQASVWDGGTGEMGLSSYVAFFAGVSSRRRCCSAQKTLLSVADDG
ncbi:unnamed protein product [Discosporangium mesarthrocarpum]